MIKIKIYDKPSVYNIYKYVYKSVDLIIIHIIMVKYFNII